MLLLHTALVLALVAPGNAAPEQRRLSVSEYRDKMKAGWVGQMVGVAWGAPTEFKVKGRIMPEEQVPKWRPEMVNSSFGQDDLYVDMTFLRSLEEHGLDVSIRQAGIDFANSGYRLWHANKAGRDNLRAGIAPPDSGHPHFNKHADDIDYQIEADFSGLIAPGLPNVAIQMGEKFGRLMNYGDGLYGGQFVGGMYAEAFFEADMEKVVEAGLQCVPAGSQFAEAISDVLEWHREEPKDWQQTWQRINDKYQCNADYRKYSCSKGDFNIDAKLNAAFIAVGLLYGERDPAKTIALAMRCGQDSDCNPSNAAGVLFTSMGFSKLPAEYSDKLDETRKFSHTTYDFPALIAACEKVARQAVVAAGGRVERDADGEEVFVLPVLPPKPSPLEQCWSPGPIANSRFTPEERKRIGVVSGAVDLSGALAKFAPGWQAVNCGEDMRPGLRTEWGGRKNVLVTHPLNRSLGCVLKRQLTLPAGSPSLRLTVGHDPRGDWVLLVKVNGQQISRQVVSNSTCENGWREVTVDLSAYAGKTATLELVNQANGWSWEAGYWAGIELTP